LLGAGTAALAQAARGGFVFPGRRGSGEDTEWVFPTTETAAVQALLSGVREADLDEMARRRIAAGIPAVPADVGPDDLPNEGGLEDVAISYTKGCYLGQEVIARLKSMGQVRRRLVRVAGAGAEIPRLPAALFLGTRQVGELRSAVGDGAGGLIGLAMLSLLHAGEDAILAFAPDAVPAIRLVAKP
jgi:folate-binding protein YgfZ